MPSPVQLWRARELVGALGIGGWAAFHLYEQWAGFAGRDAYVARTLSTSVGTLATLTEVALGVLPLLAYLVLDGLTFRAKEPPALAGALADDPDLALRLGRIGRWGSRVLALFLLYHIAWLWLPQPGSEDPEQTWSMLHQSLGTWPHVIGHAIGITALAVHVWQSVPRLALVLGLVQRAEMLRALRVSGLIVGVGVLFLFAQLAGWHASGTGIVWPLGPESW
ncbi:MAG: hypothetical protein AB8I08_05110 [Sandaracinaceae bacterium]